MVPPVGQDVAPGGTPGSPAELFDAFLSAADRAGVGIALLQVAPVLRAVFVSARCAQILGTTVQELLARPPLNLFSPEKMREIGEILSRHREGDMPPPTFEARVHRADGREIALEYGVGATTVYGQPGSVIFIRDATERLRLQAQLIRADRLAALGTMAAGVAHEINNPLAFVQLALENIERRLADSSGTGEPAIRALLADVHHGIDRIAAVARQLRTFSRTDDVPATEPPPQSSLREVLLNACRMVEREIQGRGRLEIDVGELPLVRGDARQLEQVFVNLLLNAAQALDPARSDGRVELQARREGDRLWVLVRDNGKGIAPEDLARVFDPFFTTKSVGLGTGLGLSICHMILQSIGGDIAIESPPGKGTSVRVTLAVGDAIEASEPEPAAPSARAVRMRILVMDDEEPILRLIARGLGAQHEVVSAGSCREATAHLTDGHFDLVLLDLRMPDGGGAQLCEWLARERPDLLSRVVLMTGGVNAEPVSAAGLSVPVLNKPFTLRDIETLLESYRPYEP